MTISIAAAVPVTARVLANVSVSFTCKPFDVFDRERQEMVRSTVGRIVDGTVVLCQGSGATIISGSGDIPALEVVCDGSTVNVADVPVLASTRPWRSGPAIAAAQISIADPRYVTGHSAGTGPLEVRVGRPARLTKRAGGSRGRDRARPAQASASTIR